MRPRVALTPDERTIHRQWSHGTIGGVVALAALLFVLTGAKQDAGLGTDARADALPLPSCIIWEDAASRAVAALVHGYPEPDLQQISDAVSRMRRARRNCETGWTASACQDYQAVIHGVTSRATSIADALSICAPLSVGTTIGARTP
jgi:hypothetical protein